ncbi:MAG: NAD(P)H-hydrate dehydratase [Clostridia bacterium]|nr:NAD(P)H-hydrate dehydratase [Clostridia bacterium]
MSEKARGIKTYVTAEEAARLLPIRRRDSHKGTYGKAAIVAGSAEYTGAAYLSVAACLRSGVGYTTLFAPKGILRSYYGKEPEALLRSLGWGKRLKVSKKEFRELLSYDSIAYGMGLGVSRQVYKGVAYLLTHYEGKLILDADGLNSLAKYGKDWKGLFARKKCDVLLTPHGREFSRLSKKSVEEVLKNGDTLATNFAREYGVVVLLKNSVSAIANGNEVVWNQTGNSGQAKGGSGDVLSGVLAGLCATGLSAFDAAKVGAYLTGRAAELAALETEEYSMLARDLISYLPASFLEVSRIQTGG